jgi:hypothetical protein
MIERTMLFVASFFKGITINKKSRLDHESLNHPETSILKYHGYIPITLQNAGLSCHFEVLWL